MHGPIVTTLTENPILTLFIVIGLGYLLGEISFFGFRFGIVGVLFVGLAVGSLGPSISVPEVIPTLGLIIFIYTIGIQSGPEFFKSLRERGYRDSVFAPGDRGFGRGTHAAGLASGAFDAPSRGRPLHGRHDEYASAGGGTRIAARARPRCRALS